MAFGSEPEKGAAINGGFLKFLTGNDPITGRFCHQNDEVRFEPQHSLMLLCNKIPALDAEDDAIWSRSRIIHFPFKFVRDPQAPHERQIDDTLKQRVKSWGPQFMLLLLEVYTEYRQTGLPPSRAVLAKNEEVRKENDVHLCWLTNNVIEEHGAYLVKAELWQRYLASRNHRVEMGEKAKFNAVVKGLYGEPKGHSQINYKQGWANVRLA